MTRPMVFANGNGNALVEVHRNDQALSENVRDVVVAIGTVIEVDAKRVLPLLCLQHMMSIGSMKHESFKVQFTHALDPGPHLEDGIEIVANAVLTFEESHLGIKVRPNFSMVPDQLQPVTLVVETAPKIGLARGEARRPRLDGEHVHTDAFKEHQPSVNPLTLIEP